MPPPIAANSTSANSSGRLGATGVRGFDVVKDAAIAEYERARTELLAEFRATVRVAAEPA